MFKLKSKALTGTINGSETKHENKYTALSSEQLTMGKSARAIIETATMPSMIEIVFAIM